MPVSQKCKTTALQLLSKYYGDTTATLYGAYYEKREDRAVKESVRELLSEMVGVDRAEKEMQAFRNV